MEDQRDSARVLPDSDDDDNTLDGGGSSSDGDGGGDGDDDNRNALACPLDHLRAQLDRVRRSPMRNGHIAAPSRHLAAYVRVTRRHFRPLGFVDMIDVANVAVDEAHRNSGHFQAFLTDLEHIAAAWGRCVYVECVRSDALRHILCKRGYEHDGSSLPSYWNAR